MIRKLGVGLIVAAALLAPAGAADAGAGITVRASESELQEQGNGFSCCTSISADGRYVAFLSYASNLVPFDTNGTGDVFVKDTMTGVVERVSIGHDEEQANGDSAISTPSISADGRFVAFTTLASSLHPNDDNNYCNTNGDQFPDNCPDVYVRDIQEGKTEPVSALNQTFEFGTGPSFSPNLSPDGRYLVYASHANNLVPNDTQTCNDLGFLYNCADIFIRDRFVGPTTTRVTAHANQLSGNGDSYDPKVSADGRFVAFTSYASNLANEGSVTACDRTGDGTTGDRCPDVLLADREMAGFELISRGEFGEPGNRGSRFPAMSPDARFIGFSSDASNLAPDANGAGDVFLRDRMTATTELVSVSTSGAQGNARSGECCDGVSVSADGRYVAFHSIASNLVEGDTVTCQHLVIESCYDNFLRDRKSGKTIRLSVAPGGVPGNSDATSPQMTPDGRYIAFDAGASNLVAGDTNQCQMDVLPGLEPCYDAFKQEIGDSDGDGEFDPFDNCPLHANSNQADGEFDGVGDVCDNCPGHANANQQNTDGDAEGNACDDDDDNDTVLDAADNCPLVANGPQADTDGDMAGDACDAPGSGNVDCSGPSAGVNSVDALKVLRYSAKLPVEQNEPCLDIGLPRMLAPPDDRLMGDVNCSGAVNSVDALLILRANAGLGVAIPAGCPEVKPGQV